MKAFYVSMDPRNMRANWTRYSSMALLLRFGGKQFFSPFCNLTSRANTNAQLFGESRTIEVLGFCDKFHPIMIA